MEGSSLSHAAIEGALDGLSRCPDTLAFVYSSLAVPNRGLTDVDAVAQFPKIQTLDVSGNKLTSLACLAELPHLLELDASGNELAQPLEFQPPHCRQSEPDRVDARGSSADAWCEGDSAVGSTLQRAVLRGNRVEALCDLSHHPYLQHLDLDNNRLSGCIGGIAGLSQLRVLSLRGNALTHLGPGLCGLPIEELRLDGNAIEELDGDVLARLPRLRVLTAARNRVSGLAGLARGMALERIDLSHNAVAGVAEAAHLGSLAVLCDVRLAGNPVAGEQYYRRRVLVRAQQLTLLDGVVVSAEEKVKALNLHGADEEARRATFEKFLPGAEFVNTLPPFQEPAVE